MDWEAIAQAVLEGSQWLQLRSWWEEEARKQARINQTQQPPGPLEEKLMGDGPFRSLQAQAQYTDQDLQQVRQVFLRAWRRVVPTGHSQPSFVKIMQGATEPYTDFLARLKVAVERAIGKDQISQILLQTLAYENANSECKRILDPLRGQGANIAEYVLACSGVGGVEHQANVFATAMATALKPQRKGTCFNCGKAGHFRKECRKRNKRTEISPVIPKQQPSGPCRRCGKGRHWTNECRSRNDKDGNPLPLRQQGNISVGLSPWGPATTPRTTNPTISQSMAPESPLIAINWYSNVSITHLFGTLEGDKALDSPRMLTPQAIEEFNYVEQQINNGYLRILIYRNPYN